MVVGAAVRGGEVQTHRFLDRTDAHHVLARAGGQETARLTHQPGPRMPVAEGPDDRVEVRPNSGQVRVVLAGKVGHPDPAADIDGSETDVGQRGNPFRQFEVGPDVLDEQGRVQDPGSQVDVHTAHVQVREAFRYRAGPFQLLL